MRLFVWSNALHDKYYLKYENTHRQDREAVWREYMHMMEDSGRYRFYGEKINEISDDQVVDRYMQMMNFLSERGNA